MGTSLNTVSILNALASFHSINIPSEWGPLEEAREIIISHERFHSINIPSEWGREYDGNSQNFTKSFHSINIPSEWGP